MIRGINPYGYGPSARRDPTADHRLAATGVKTASYIAAAGELVLCDATNAGFAVTLPTTPVVGSRVTVKKLDSTTNAVTVTCGGSDLIITGVSTTSATASLSLAEAREFVFDGTSRWIVASGQTPMSTLDARYGTALVINAKDNGLKGDGTTNDQPALAALVSSLGSLYASDGKPRAIFVPAGNYAMRDAGTVWKSGVSLIGAGPGQTRFLLSNPGSPTNPTPLVAYTVTFHGASTSTPLTDCTFAHFEVDGSGVSLASYNVGAKALVMQYMVRARFTDLYLHDCGATGLGCDFLQDSIIDGVLSVGNGRLNNGSQPGGAGIGIGIGGWGASERTTITNCVTRNNGTHGIFFELQDNSFTRPKGLRVIGCHSEGNRYGISDWGADGLIVSGCTMAANTTDGFNVSGSGVAGVAGRGGVLIGSVIDGNTADGVHIGDTPGGWSVRGCRISGNGQHGVHMGNTVQSASFASTECTIEGCEIHLNANAGIRIDGTFTDGAINANRIRNNGTATGAATDLRSGISINQPMNSPTLQDNRCWDNQGSKTQTYGIYLTATGQLGSATVQGNNLNGNLTAAFLSLGTISGGIITANQGLAPGTTTSAATTLIDGPQLVSGASRWAGATRSFTGTSMTPSAAANTNGTSQTCSPSTGQQGFVLLSMLRAVFAGTFGSETATVTATATFSDNSTATATVAATATGTQVLGSSGLLSLAKDGLYVKSIAFALQSTIGSSLVTATPALVAAQC